MRPLLSGTGVATHAWSVGASEGPDTVLLDNMEEGITRLLTCSLCKRTQSEGVKAPDDTVYSNFTAREG